MFFHLKQGFYIMSVGFGIVGCGLIANFHAKALEEIRGAKLVACYSEPLVTAKNFADKQGCTAYDSLAAMLADPKVDAVAIATPSGVHMDPAVEAAKAGKHVVVEKPLEITLKRCDKIINACEKAGVKLATIFPSRFHDAPKKVKKALDQGRFGDIALGNAYVKWFRTQEYYDGGAWRGTWALDGGGALMNQAIHSIDLLTWFMGPVAEIRAQMGLLAHKRIEVEDTAVASVRFESGALGTIVATTAAYPGYLKQVEIHGSLGTAVMEEEDIKVWDFAKKKASDAAILKGMQEQKSDGGGASDPAAIGHHGHKMLLQDFVDAIRKDRTPAVDGYEGRRSVETILAIYKAAETGKAVQLPLKSDPKLNARTNGVGATKETPKKPAKKTKKKSKKK